MRWGASVIAITLGAVIAPVARACEAGLDGCSTSSGDPAMLTLGAGGILCMLVAAWLRRTADQA